MTSSPELAQHLPNGLLVACYGCSRAGKVDGATVEWDEKVGDRRGSTRPMLCPSCWVGPTKEKR